MNQLEITCIESPTVSTETARQQIRKTDTRVYHLLNGSNHRVMTAGKILLNLQEAFNEVQYRPEIAIKLVRSAQEELASINKEGPYFDAYRKISVERPEYFRNITTGDLRPETIKGLLKAVLGEARNYQTDKVRLD